MRKLVSFIVGVVCMCFFVMPTEAKAAGSVVQSSSQETAADIRWTQNAGEARYEVYIWMPTSYWQENKLHTNYSLEYLGETTQTQFHFSNLTGGEKYSIIIRVYDAEGIFVEDVEGEIKTLPAKVELADTLLKWSSYYTESQKATMTFNLYVDIVSQSGVDGYEVKVCNKEGKTVKKAKVSAKESSIQRKAFYSLKDSFYIVKARAYQEFNGKTYYGKWSDKSWAIRQPMCAAKPTSSQLYIRWEKIEGATGYDVYMCTEKLGEYVKVASVGTKKTMISVKKFNKKKLKKGKQYHYYVLAKKKSGKKVYESVISYRFKVVNR